MHDASTIIAVLLAIFFGLPILALILGYRPYDKDHHDSNSQ